MWFMGTVFQQRQQQKKDFQKRCNAFRSWESNFDSNPNPIYIPAKEFKNEQNLNNGTNNAGKSTWIEKKIDRFEDFARLNCLLKTVEHLSINRYWSGFDDVTKMQTSNCINIFMHVNNDNDVKWKKKRNENCIKRIFISHAASTIIEQK